jgi:hypothetical protein
MAAAIIGFMNAAAIGFIASMGFIIGFIII